MKMPNGIPSSMPYEVLGVYNFEPDMEREKQLHGTTHYDFRVKNRRDGWTVLARPWANWKERQEAAMREMGL